MVKKQNTSAETQQERYEVLRDAVGDGLAIFYCCLLFDVPFVRLSVPKRNIKDNRWLVYLDALGSDATNLTFMDGQLTYERDGTGDKNDARWKREWGTGDEENPYTLEDYRQLDSLYAMYTARINSAGAAPDAQQEDTLRTCCKLRLQSDRAINKPTKESVDIAAKLNKMIQDLLAAENLRKRDEKPIENVRIDSIVDALEKAGMMHKGKILNLPDLQEKLLERLGALGGKPSHKYPYTLDAADQMAQYIVNAMRANDGMAEIPYSPENMCFDENVAAEFAARPNEAENDAYAGLDLVRWRGRDARGAKKAEPTLDEEDD